MLIRAARPGDARAVREVCAAIWDGDYVPDMFREWARDRRGRLWVAAEAGRVVGVAKLTVLPSGEAWLHGLRVHPDHQRRGIATALLEHRLARARRLGAKVARLDTSEDNVAVRRLMRRYGFHRIERISLYHATPTRAEPPRRARMAELDALWRIAGAQLFHEDYVTRRLVRADIARAIRMRACFVLGDPARALAIAERQRGTRSRLRIRVAAGRGLREMLTALRGEARRARLARAAIAPPAPLWPAVRAAGYRRRWHDAMYVFERRL